MARELFPSKMNETISGNGLLTPGRLYKEMCHGGNGIVIALCWVHEVMDFFTQNSLLKDHVKHWLGVETNV